MSEPYDYAIVGAGIAGASLAAELAPHGRVLLIEAEDRPGYHSTGRSAAFWTESYGGPGVQPLTTASGPFLADNGFLMARGALTLARAEEIGALDAFIAEFSALGVVVQKLDRAALQLRLPGLRDEWVAGAFEPDCSDIDVAGLHQFYLAAARRSGTELWTRARLIEGQVGTNGCQLTMADERSASAAIVIDAAGAWADEVAKACSVAPLGIQPYRRTVVQLEMRDPLPAELPLTLGIDGSFYFKPEAGRLWLSPHDETPCPPCDAAPEELDVALALDRFEHVVDWPVRRIEHKWAGLRSFAPDRLPIIGFDAVADRFFWCAGQGGFGIQTAPAAAELARRLLRGEAPGKVDPRAYDPARLR
jgi:D-arginine dehydrogenase